MKRFHCAFVGPLKEGASPHTPALLSACDAATRQVRQAWNAQLDLVMVDDGACAEGGERAAREVLRSNVGAVVGHFASASAEAAAPWYAAASLPLFLPGATQTCLTKHEHVVRVCDNDADQARWIDGWFEREKTATVAVAHDETAHGRSLAAELFLANPNRFTRDTARNLPAVFCGSCGNAIAFALDAQAPGDLYLSDDAQVDHLFRHIGASRRRVRVFGFRRAATHTARAYVLETIAAFELAVAHLLGRNLAAAPIPTALGELRVDASRECRPRRFQVFDVCDGGLREARPEQAHSRRISA